MTQLPAIPVRAGNPCLENRCSACCEDTEMLLTLQDVERLTHHHPGLDFWFLAPDGYRQLRTVNSPNGGPRPCVFLQSDGRCGVHDHRPEGCRLYPAVWDGRRALLDGAHCPYTQGFSLDSSTAKAVGSLGARLEQERVKRVRGG